MRKLFKFALFVAILFVNVSCNSRNKINDEIKAFHGSHIELPTDSMMNVSSMRQVNSYKEARYVYVIYVDSTSCSECAISHLTDWSQLDIMDAFKKGLLRYLFVVAPKHSQRTHVLNLIKRDTLFNEFVYVDTMGIFERKNPKLPTNKLLHTFLINSQGEVELIGNPIVNTEIKKLLIKITEKGHKDNFE
jgi:hypothetical protein